MSEPLLLEILGSKVKLDAPPEWLEVALELWAPFIRQDGSPEASVVVRKEKDRWSYKAPGLDMQYGRDAWDTMVRIRAYLGPWAIERSGLIGLHGGLIAKDGAAVLLVGSGGSGKSSAAAYMASNGFRFGGDDLVGLSPDSGKVHPYPAPVALVDHGLWLHLNRGWTPPSFVTPSASTTGLFLIPSVLFDVTLAPLDVPCVIFVRYQPKRSGSLEQVSRGHALTRIAQEALGLVPGNMQALRGLIHDASIFRLDYPSLDGLPSLIYRAMRETGP